jgi:glucosylceramidase
MKRRKPSSQAKLDGFKVEVWLTRRDKSALFAKQEGYLPVGVAAPNSPTITVTPSIEHQVMDGFGFTLTGGSADLISQLPQKTRDSLLLKLFSTMGDGIGVTCLRIGIGATDLSKVSYSYDDLLPGETDSELEQFNLAAGDVQIVPLLKEIRAINPNIRIIATPWSAPPWMKTNQCSMGGRLKAECYGIYAKYFIKFISEMKSHGVLINAITPQNEPLNPGEDPSMLMSPLEQTDFIGNHLGPALQDAGLRNDVELFCYDHNCDYKDYPLAVLRNEKARGFIAGVAWHLYEGKIEVLSEVARKYPGKKVYFTEQWVEANGDFARDLVWHVENVLIGASRHGARAILEWNLAGDPHHGPHTQEACQKCLGALTIKPPEIQYNLSYYVIAHLSRFVGPGSVKIDSKIDSKDIDSLPNVAFTTPDGHAVLLVLNKSSDMQFFSIQCNGQTASHILDGGAVGTYVWKL